MRYRVLLLFVLLTGVITYPQVRVFRSAVIADQADRADAYLNMWRIAWIAHQLPRDPLHLFDANIFFPEEHTFAYTDGMLLPAVSVAPLIWAGASLVTVHNLMVLGALALSGFTMFLFARRLTGSAMAGVLAGVVFAFAPFRLEQYDHVEVEMAFWMPLALVQLHQTLRNGRVRDGALLGALVALQALSGMYDAIFFVTYLAVLAPVLVWAEGIRRPWQVAGALTVGGLIAAAIVLTYAQPFLRVHDIVGDQSFRETERYSATWSSFLASPSINRLYGWTAARFGGPELNLFPGLVAFALAVVGISAARSRTAVAYLVAMAILVELSLGFNGTLYPYLYAHVGIFRGLRVPARFDLDVMLSLAVIAAIGAAHLFQKCKTRPRRLAVFVIVLAGMVIEYASSPVLAGTPRQPSAVDRWLTGQNRVVLLELPFAPIDRPNDPLYMYEASAHWQPMVNGYSGYFPPSYLDLMAHMEKFDEASVAYMRKRGINYVIVRERLYDADVLRSLRATLAAHQDIAFVGEFRDSGAGELDALVYALK